MSKIYRHYKGNLYEYQGECLHSETLEEMVIYKALYGEGKTWVRPKSMFFEDVTLADGNVVPRFAPVDAEEIKDTKPADEEDNEAVMKALSDTPKFDRDRMTSRLYSELHQLFEQEERS